MNLCAPLFHPVFPELAEGLVLSVNCGLTSRAHPKDASLAPVSGTSAWES